MLDVFWYIAKENGARGLSRRLTRLSSESQIDRDLIPPSEKPKPQQQQSVYIASLVVRTLQRGKSASETPDHGERVKKEIEKDSEV